MLYNISKVFAHKFTQNIIGFIFFIRIHFYNILLVHKDDFIIGHKSFFSNGHKSFLNLVYMIFFFFVNVSIMDRQPNGCQERVVNNKET